MTVKDGALKVITEQIIRVNQYQIEDSFATELAKQILKKTRITGTKSRKLSSPAAYIKHSDNTLEVKCFDTIKNAIAFAAEAICEVEVVWHDSIVEWVPLGKRILFKDVETGKIFQINRK